jgi:hypothetical protein
MLISNNPIKKKKKKKKKKKEENIQSMEIKCQNQLSNNKNNQELSTACQAVTCN